MRKKEGINNIYMYVTKEQIQQAYQCNLYEYLLSHHPDKVEKKGRSLRLISNHSISVAENYFGYHDFANNENGTGITLLMKYFRYSFPEAVISLLNSQSVIISPNKCKEKKFELPDKANKPPTRITEYLSVERGLSRSFVKWMIDKNILYQDIYSNCVFVSPNKDFFEIRGIYDKSFHKNNDLSKDNTNFWYFKNPESRTHPHKIYICESSIDAASLYQIIHEDAYYCSIGGVSNQSRIDRIKALPLEVITAFDCGTDEAANKARLLNNDIQGIYPIGFKDWNELLRKGDKDKWKYSIKTMGILF